MIRRGRNVPIGVKIISILYYVAAGIFALTSLTFIILAIIALAINPDLGGSLQELPSFVISSSNLGIIILVAGLFIGFFAVLSFFIGKHLSKAKWWAKILVIIFAFINLIAGVIYLVGGNLFGIINLIFSVLIGGYLLFSNQAKSFFAR